MASVPVGLTVTAEHLRRAEAADACALPVEGTPIGDMSWSDVLWAEEHGVLSVADLMDVAASLDEAGWRVRLPAAWMLSGDGYGYGYGDGDGSGYGSGDDSGSGYGDGDGSGYGSGDDSGYGYGYGSGYGSGYGDGSGESA